MNGINLSGKPGIVQPMQMPPTLGQPPIPAIQPRFGTLQFTTGPQQPSFTMHLGELYEVAKSHYLCAADASLCSMRFNRRSVRRQPERKAEVQFFRNLPRAAVVAD
jgi:hypothetical protein